MGVVGAYVLCTSPRSGSTMLCRLLRDTGIAGHPGSHFHDPSLPAWREAHGLPANAPLHDIFAAAVDKGRAGTGIFGLRLQRHSFAFFMARLADLYPDAPNDMARFRAAFGHTRFIYLKRTDKVAQAISYVRAQQTGLWHTGSDGREIERLSPPAPPRYDSDALWKTYQQMQGYDRLWEDWFREAGISPLRLLYDDLAIHPVETLGAVLGTLGLDPRIAETARPDTAQLSDDLSLSWATRFRAEYGLAEV